jgi:acyl-CoA dehydrogenase
MQSAPHAIPRFDRVLHPVSPREIIDEAERQFAPWLRACVNPGAADRDRDGTPIDCGLLREAGMLGLLGFTLPRSLGGQQRSWREWGFVLHELGYHTEDTAVPMLLAYCSTVTKLLYDTGRTDLIDRYVKPMIRGRLLGGFAWSEGRDPFAFQTTVRRTETGFVLDGEKTPVANGQIADVVMVFAKSAETGDVVTVLVERQDPGVEIVARNAMGLRAAGMASWRFHQVAVPATRLIVDADAISWGQRFLNERRIEMPCWALGRMRRLVEACVNDLSTRIRYGRPLTEMQTVQAMIGRMVIVLESSRLIVRSVLDQVGAAGTDFLWEPQFAIVKSHVVEHGLQLVRLIQDVTGGYGVLDGFPYERTCRDLQCLNPIAGTLATLEVDLGNLAIEELAHPPVVRSRRRTETHEDPTLRQSTPVLELPEPDRG